MIIMSIPYDRWNKSWFESYLTGRKQCVHCRNSRSLSTMILCGVPRGSVRGPILFLLDTADLLRLVDSHHLHPHLYADDTQIYSFSDPSGASQLQLKVLACVDEVSMWMRSNRLHLNPAKTEVLWRPRVVSSSQLRRTCLVWGVMLSHRPQLFVTREFISTRVSQ